MSSRSQPPNMRHFSLLALATAIAITAGLVVVLGGQEREQPQPIVHAAAEIAEDTSTTTTAVDVLDAILVGLDPAEEEFVTRALDEAVEFVTTTTVPPPPNTTSTTTPKRSAPPTTAPNQPTPTTATPTTTTPTHVAEFRSDYEADFYGRINSLRSSNGLPGLTRDGSLNSRARDWAKQMAANGSLSHSNLSSLLPPWSAAAENLGKGGAVNSVFSALAGSGGHYSNMVGDFTNVGIGVWTDSSGVLWTVHVFTR